MVIQPGDWVRLKAGGGSMMVVKVSPGGDGTGGDGAGLLCHWVNGEGAFQQGWLSESSVEPVLPGEWTDHR